MSGDTATELVQLLRDGLQFQNRELLQSVPARLEALRTSRPDLPHVACGVLCTPSACDTSVRQAAGTVLRQLLAGLGGGDASVRAAILQASLTGDTPEVCAAARACVATALTAAGGPRGWPEVFQGLLHATQDAGTAETALACLTTLAEDHPEALGDVALGCPVAGMLPPVVALILSPNPATAKRAAVLASLLMSPDVGGGAEQAQHQAAAGYVGGLLKLAAGIPRGADPDFRGLLCRGLGESCAFWSSVPKELIQGTLMWVLDQLEGSPTPAAAAFWANVAGCEPAEGALMAVFQRVLAALLGGVAFTDSDLSEINNTDDAHIPDKALFNRGARRRGRGSMVDPDAAEDGVDSDSESGRDDDDDAEVVPNSIRAEARFALGVLGDSHDAAIARVSGEIFARAQSTEDWRVREAVLQFVVAVAEKCTEHWVHMMSTLVNWLMERMKNDVPVVRDAAYCSLGEIACALLSSSDDLESDSDDDTPARAQAQAAQAESVSSSPLLLHMLQLLLSGVNDRNKKCQGSAVRAVLDVVRHGIAASAVPGAVTALVAALPSVQNRTRREIAFAIASIFQRRPHAAAAAAGAAVAALNPFLSGSPEMEAVSASALSACAEIVSAASEELGKEPGLVAARHLCSAAGMQVCRTAELCAAGKPFDIEIGIQGLDLCDAIADVAGDEFGSVVGGNCTLLHAAFQLLRSASSEESGVHEHTYRSLQWSVVVVCGDFARGACNVLASEPGGAEAIVGFLSQQIAGLCKEDACGAERELLSNALWAFGEVTMKLADASWWAAGAVVPEVCVRALLAGPPEVEPPEWKQNAAVCLARCVSKGAQCPQDPQLAQIYCLCGLALEAGDELTLLVAAAPAIFPPQNRRALGAQLITRTAPGAVVSSAAALLQGGEDCPVADPVLFTFMQVDSDRDHRWGLKEAAALAGRTGDTLGAEEWKRLCKFIKCSPSRGLDIKAARSLYSQGLRNPEADYTVAVAAAVEEARAKLGV
eukprot:Hpha_TRINITY_DN15032_c7_g6::TRINITY_DN15032_c7_g6_i1::g.124273::m.124273/K18752/TNPO1, IPO2, KPNB2; transportin-1